MKLALKNKDEELQRPSAKERADQELVLKNVEIREGKEKK